MMIEMHMEFGIFQPTYVRWNGSPVWYNRRKNKSKSSRTYVFFFFANVPKVFMKCIIIWMRGYACGWSVCVCVCRQSAIPHLKSKHRSFSKEKRPRAKCKKLEYNFCTPVYYYYDYRSANLTCSIEPFNANKKSNFSSFLLLASSSFLLNKNICKWCFRFWLFLPLLLLLLFPSHSARLSPAWRQWQRVNFNYEQEETHYAIWKHMCKTLWRWTNMITFAYFISMLHNQRELKFSNTLAHSHSTYPKWNWYLERKRVVKMK